MSKKTRKKSSKGSSSTSSRTSSKTLARKTATAKAAHGGSKASVKTPAAKARMAVAKKSSKAAKTALGKASHKPTSKPLKSKVSAAPKSDSKPIPKPDSQPARLVEGAKAPSFRLPRDGGDTVSLADYDGQKLVLFFYPRADTPGCTREAIDFTRLNDAFAGTGTAVLGISADTVKAQESFRNKHRLGVPLISDEKHEMLEAYGAWGEKSMYGRTFLGIIRTTVLIGADGKIAKIWRNVRVDGHADEVLATARSA